MAKAPIAVEAALADLMQIECSPRPARRRLVREGQKVIDARPMDRRRAKRRQALSLSLVRPATAAALKAWPMRATLARFVPVRRAYRLRTSATRNAPTAAAQAVPRRLALVAPQVRGLLHTLCSQTTRPLTNPTNAALAAVCPDIEGPRVSLPGRHVVQRLAAALRRPMAELREVRLSRRLQRLATLNSSLFATFNTSRATYGLRC